MEGYDSMTGLVEMPARLWLSLPISPPLSKEIAQGRIDMPAYRFDARCFALPLLTLLLLGAVPLAASAAVLNVPSQYATIGAAVSAASSGDTIDVSPGTYSAQDLLTSKILTIQSVDGAASTVIDCDGNYFGTFQGSGTTIQGFTFENSTNSLGVIDAQTSMTISDCVFQNNNSGFNFSPSCINTAGVSNTVHVTNCSFSSNSGLGALQVNSILDVSNCTFTDNTGQFGSGAVYANTATGTFTNCTFTGNESDSEDQGGAVYWVNGAVTFAGCTFTGNSSGAAGGAVEVGAQGLDSPATFTRCTFQYNSAPYGGAVGLNISSNHDATATAVDCVFVGNSASSDESAIGSHGNAVPVGINLVNCSFYGNSYTGGSASGQGAIGGDGQTTLDVSNCILYGDTTPHEISTNNVAASTSIANTDSRDGVVNGVNGNMIADPKYAAGATGDLHLLMSSPCVQAGTSTGAPATDFSQYTWGSAVSMGAYSPVQFMLSTPLSATKGSSFIFDATATAADGTTTITNYAGTVHFTSSDAAALLPDDTSLTNGTGTFAATLNTDGNQTITATDTSTSAITGTSSDISVAGPATHFSVSAPSTTTSYVGFDVTVTALDAQGNTATGYTGTVHLTSTDPGFADITGDSTLTNGVGTFYVGLKTAGTQTITATDTVNSSITGTSGDITVAPGPAVRYVVTAPSTATVDVSFEFTVTAQDLWGNTATGYAGTVHFTSTAPSAGLPSDSTLTNGTGTFVAMPMTAGDLTITATDTVTSSITGTSNTIVVSSRPTLTTFPAGLQMISAPADYTGLTPSQIFSPGISTLAAWDPLLARYAVTPTAPADTIHPGQGYWARFAATASLLDNGQHVDQTQPFSITLSRGWNMIGDPFTQSVPLSSLHIKANGVLLKFPTGKTLARPVMDHLYTYPAGATAYEVETVSLKPYVGYWLYAYQNCALIVTAGAGGS